MNCYQSFLYDMIPVLSDAHKKTPIEPRVDKLNTLFELIDNNDFINYEPYLVNNILPIILKRLDDKPKVSEIALGLGQKLMSKLSIQAFPLVLNVLSKEMVIEAKWKAKLGSLKLLSIYVKRVFELDRDLLSVSLPELVNILTPLLHDTKFEVAELASEVSLMALKGITNRDLEPFIEDLLKAIKVREETEETIQKLGGVVFVQTVEGSALSVVIPLMLAGFRTNKAIIKRMCSRIVSNMSKLVEEPIEALPFLSELIPAIGEAIDTISDPEARDVATKTHQSLISLQEKGLIVEQEKQFRKLSNIESEIIKMWEKDFDDETRIYIANIISSLISTKTVDEEEYIFELKNYISENLKEEVIKHLYQKSKEVIGSKEIEEIEDDGEELCDCEFTLAYGTKILLHNTKLKLKKGRKYGLLGQNDCGKTTLMRAIAEGSVDGFPESSEVKTVFVEADIQGELSHLDCVNYVLEFPAIKNLGATEEMVRNVLKQVGFSEGKSAGAGGDCDDPISSLSGGWRMKLALARAMLQKADILLMDEPTNHLDVKNVKWVESYINSLSDTTVIMVSHDSGLLDNCCDYILQIDKLKLKLHKGNLTQFVKIHPEAQSYFEFKATKFKFTFPQPCFLDGVKSRGKALMKMDNVCLTYPGNKVPTIQDITVRASMASRVACVGVNGAGKSTMIKVLTGELEPTQGTVWKYPNTRVGYIAQHAFHHIEKHLNRTPNEYIRWRFQFGDDREGLDKATMKLSDKDREEMSKPVQYAMKNEKGQIKKEDRVIKELTGQRREQDGKKKIYEYEVRWKDRDFSQNSWLTEETLVKYNRIYEKVLRMIDHKISAREQMAIKPLTQENVEKHLGDVGLEPEYATHFRINALSGGQKVKVVLAAAMWDQPHILILDEPTNYLDRDSLGALAEAIEKYEGGVIMITHNDAFCRQLCPERWVLEKGRLNTEGDVEWMKKMTEQAVEFKQVDEMIDATGNEVKIKRKKKLNAKEKKKMMKQIKQKIVDGEDLDSDEENYAIEWNL